MENRESEIKEGEGLKEGDGDGDKGEGNMVETER
jgi:hypothetical protein